MSAISLREYIRKIENLIDNNEIDQAISHCKYILQIYPKHIDSYRLLGKAFLEKQKYGDASDIFQRVLSSIPDDFISHIGMSIIREDENNLDASIWHMERAFEVQPSNKAVQDELRRLYTNRDGVAPPKIRLTRGALVRMYSRGELYEQAIGEINAALTEDPNRVDLEVLLAKIYFLLGQKIEATETCSKLITKLPYCYEANKILTEVLPGTSREEDQKIFKQRVIELDPYFEFTSEQILNATDVSDSNIMIDYQEWDPLKNTYDQPDWAKSIGLEVDNENSLDNDISFWLSDTDNVTGDSELEDTTQAKQPFIDEELEIDNVEEVDDIQEPLEEEVDLEKIEDEDITLISKTTVDEVDQSISEVSEQSEIKPETPNEDLPDWLKEAGWEKSESEDPEILKGFSIPPLLDEVVRNGKEEEELEVEEDNIEPADIPDWIREIAPKDELTGPEEIENEDEFELQNLEDLLTNLEGSDADINLSESSLHWENEFEKQSEPSNDQFGSELESEDVEDKTKPLSPINEINDLEIDSEEDDLDWLKNIQIEDDQIIGTESEQSISDILEKATISNQDLEDEIETDDDDWLSSLLDEKEPEVLSSSDLQEKDQEKIEISEDVPDWIKSVINEEELPVSEIDYEMEMTSQDAMAFSDDQGSEKIEDIKITFDDSDEIEISDMQGITDELESIKQDEYEEQLVDETLSKLEEELNNRSEEISSSDQLSPDEDDVGIQEQESKIVDETEKLPTNFDWLKNLDGDQQIQEKEEIEMGKTFDSEEPPEWVSEILKSAPEEQPEEFDSTPSWLRELEIETENVIDSDDQPIDLTESETINIDEQAIVDHEDQDTSQDLIAELPGTEEEMQSESEEEFVLPEDEVIVENEEYVTKDLDVIITDLSEEMVVPDDDLQSEVEYENREMVDEFSSEMEEADLEKPAEEVLAVTEDSVIEGVDGFSSEDKDKEHIIEEEKVEDADLGLPEQEFEDVDPGLPEQELEEVDRIPDDSSIVDQEDLRINDLKEANKLLNSGELDQSINLYNDLIRDELFLDDVIKDIQSALDHHYPIDINLWQTLGDAYLKTKQLQKALDAYSKAEDLLS